MRSFLFALLPVFIFSGCVPYIDSYVDYYGFQGTLVDSDTGNPIPCIPVRITVVDGLPSNESDELTYPDFRKKDIERVTQKSGEFFVRPEYQLYWTWPMCGPSHVNSIDPVVTISVEGFMPYQVSYETIGWNDAPDELVKPTIENDYILMGKILLKKDD